MFVKCSSAVSAAQLWNKSGCTHFEPFQPFRHKWSTPTIFCSKEHSKRNFTSKMITHYHLINYWRELVYVTLVIPLGTWVSLSPFSIGQRAMSATEQPTSCCRGLNLLFKGTRASHHVYELPMFLLKDNRSVSVNNRPPSPANIHYSTRKSTFVTLIILALSFVHIL